MNNMINQANDKTTEKIQRTKTAYKWKCNVCKKEMTDTSIKRLEYNSQQHYKKHRWVK